MEAERWGFRPLVGTDVVCVCSGRGESQQWQQWQEWQRSGFLGHWAAGYLDPESASRRHTTHLLRPTSTHRPASCKTPSRTALSLSLSLSALPLSRLLPLLTRHRPSSLLSPHLSAVRFHLASHSLPRSPRQPVSLPLPPLSPSLSLSLSPPLRLSLPPSLCPLFLLAARRRRPSPTPSCPRAC